MQSKCTLLLSNGMSFEGELVGSSVVSSGELIFTTGMVGYTEALTDPSYFGQILTFSYPLIGNYGVPDMARITATDLPKGFESQKIHASAVIMAYQSAKSFHWNSVATLDHWLKSQGVCGITGIDTRHLVHLIRSCKKLFGRVIPNNATGSRDLAEPLNSYMKDGYLNPGEHCLLPHVSRRQITSVGKGKKRIGLIDCGVKWNIVRSLVELGSEVQLLPWDTDLTRIDCDAWVISNGPGDPVNTGDLNTRVSRLLEEDRPILGICLGHQILALASGATTAPLPYGHRSHNQPVLEIGSRRAYLTSQNHGYVALKETLQSDWEPWFTNANDGTIEGIRHIARPFRSVQFHPEASAGPRDTAWILRDFVQEVKN